MTAIDRPRPSRTHGAGGRHRAPVAPVGSPFDEWSTVALPAILDPVTDALPVIDPHRWTAQPLVIVPSPRQARPGRRQPGGDRPMTSR